MDCSLCECITSARHLDTAACRRSTAAVPAPTAMILLRVNRFATDLTRCTFVGACQNNA